MVIPEILAWIENTPVATAIRQSTWLFPAIETVHVLATVIVVGSVSMLDLRLLDIAWRDYSIREVHEDVLPWTWTSFGVAAIAGSLLFSSSATKYYHNGPFRIKMVLLVLVAFNAACFELATYQRIANPEEQTKIPMVAKVAGGLGLVLWIGVVACGRWIGFTK
jgi:Family of unknown function (DUF6644)